MKSSLVTAVAVVRLLFGCDPTPPAAHDAGHDANVPTHDASNPADASTTDASTADAGRDASVVTCPQARQVPFPEVCNAFDDDCDGVMDEGACNDPCDEAW